MNLEKEEQKFRENNEHPSILKWVTSKFTKPFKNFVYPPKEPTTLARGSMNCWLKGKVHNYETYEMQRDYCHFCGRWKRMSGHDYAI